MKGRAQAVLAISLLTILSWVFSLIGLLSSASVALPVLRKGPSEGLVIATISLLPVVVAGWMIWGTPLPAAAYVLALWAPIWLIALLLRESGRLALALAGISGLGMLMVVALYASLGDPAAVWLKQLQRFLEPLLKQQASAADAELLWRNFADFAPYFTGVIAAGLVLALSLSLLIARGWQALLFNPGGFRAEFVKLRAPPAAAYLVLALLASAWAIGGKWMEMAANLVLPLAMLFLLAGFAVLHALLSDSGSGKFWLVGIYMALLFVSPLVMAIMLVGFSDIWIDWRQRLSRA
jgi:hypothetical protein